MYKLSALLLILVLPVAALAAVTTVPVSADSVTILSHEGRSLTAFTLDLAELEPGALLESVLELLVVPNAPEGEPFVELQAAAWVNGSPQLPAGKASYVSEIVADRDATATLYLDLTPILLDAQDGEESAVTIAVGAISADALTGAMITPWDVAQNTWGVVRLHHR